MGSREVEGKVNAEKKIKVSGIGYRQIQEGLENLKIDKDIKENRAGNRDVCGEIQVDK